MTTVARDRQCATPVTTAPAEQEYQKRMRRTLGAR
jgi:hypothetical protein